MKHHPQQVTVKRDRGEEFWPVVLAVLITGGAILLISAWGLVSGKPVSNPSAGLLLAVAFSAFCGGFRGAVTSVAIAVAFQWLNSSEPGTPFRYGPGIVLQDLLFSLACPILAAVIASLKRQGEITARQLALKVEREKHDQDLQRERARLESLVHYLPFGLVMFDLNQKMLLSNPRAGQVLGHSPEDMDQRGCDRMFHPDRTPYLPSELPLVRALQGEIVRDEDMLYVRGDGKMITLRMNAAAVLDGDAKTIGAAVTVEDVTAQKQAQHAREQLSAIVEASDDAIYLMSPEGVILTWNGGAERLFGYTAEEARYMNVTSLMPSEAQEQYETMLALLRAGKHVAPIRAKRLRKDGTMISVSVRPSPLCDRTGALQAISVIARLHST